MMLVLPWKIKWQQLDAGRLFRKAVIPLAILILITIIGIGPPTNKYFGDPQVSFRNYCVLKNSTNVPMFFFQSLRHMPAITFKAREDYVKLYSEKMYLEKKTIGGFFEHLAQDSFAMINFYLGYILAIPGLILLLIFSIQSRTAVRFATALLLLISPYALAATNLKPHYFSSDHRVGDFIDNGRPKEFIFVTGTPYEAGVYGCNCFNAVAVRAEHCPDSGFIQG